MSVLQVQSTVKLQADITHTKSSKFRAFEYRFWATGDDKELAPIFSSEGDDQTGNVYRVTHFLAMDSEKINWNVEVRVRNTAGAVSGWASDDDTASVDNQSLDVSGVIASASTNPAADDTLELGDRTHRIKGIYVMPGTTRGINFMEAGATTGFLRLCTATDLTDAAGLVVKLPVYAGTIPTATNVGSAGKYLKWAIGGASTWETLPAATPHVLATTGALPAEHTVSGLTAGPPAQVLKATAATSASFVTLAAGDIPNLSASQITSAKLAIAVGGTYSNATDLGTQNMFLVYNGTRITASAYDQSSFAPLASPTFTGTVTLAAAHMTENIDYVLLWDKSNGSGAVEYRTVTELRTDMGAALADTPTFTGTVTFMKDATLQMAELIYESNRTYLKVFYPHATESSRQMVTMVGGSGGPEIWLGTYAAADTYGKWGAFSSTLRFYANARPIRFASNTLSQILELHNTTGRADFYGGLYPLTTSSQDIGEDSKRWQKAYAEELDLAISGLGSGGARPIATFENLSTMLTSETSPGEIKFLGKCTGATNQDRMGAFIRTWADGAWSTDHANYAPTTIGFFAQDATTTDMLVGPLFQIEGRWQKVSVGRLNVQHNPKLTIYGYQTGVGGKKVEMWMGTAGLFHMKPTGAGMSIDLSLAAATAYFHAKTGSTGMMYLDFGNQVQFRKYAGGTAMTLDQSSNLAVTGNVTGANLAVSDWNSAFSHVSASGVSHGYLDQSVVQSATPSFTGLTLTDDLDMGSNYINTVLSQDGGTPDGFACWSADPGYIQYRSPTQVRADIGAGTGSGTVTSVAAGNGMDFTTITTTGSVTMGTPSSVTGSSTNSVTGTSHAHALSLSTVSIDELSDVTLDSPANDEILQYSTGQFVNRTLAVAGIAPLASPTFSGTVTLSGLTASQIVETNASKQLISAAKSTAYNKAFGSGSGTVCQGNDARLSDARTPTVHGNTYHSPNFESAFSKNTAFNKNFAGTGSATTVSKSDHTHGVAGHELEDHDRTELTDAADANIIIAETPGVGENDWGVIGTGLVSATTPIGVTGSRRVIGGTMSITHSTVAGYKHIPSGGATNNFLQYSASGTAVWSTVAWGEVASKPGTFPPSTHYHSGADITSGSVDETKGGTGITTYARGEILYASGGNTLYKLPAEDAGMVLTLSDESFPVPFWEETMSQRVEGVVSDYEVLKNLMRRHDVDYIPHAGAVELGWLRQSKKTGTWSMPLKYINDCMAGAIIEQAKSIRELEAKIIVLESFEERIAALEAA